MRNLITKLLLLSAFLLSAFVFASCGASDGGEATDTDSQAKDDDFVYIVKDGSTDFYIIRSDFADKKNVETAVNLRRAIGEASGVEPGITTDWEKNQVYEHEIIVGETLREQNGVKIDRVALGETGYSIKEVGGKIYIAGGSDEGTALACDYFIKTFVKSGSDIKIPVGYDLVVYHQYDIPELYINMNLVDSSYKIVIPENADKKVEESAERLKQAIYDKTGQMLDIEKGKADAQNAFVLSSEVPDVTGIYEIRTEGTSLIFESSAKTGIAGCVDRFIQLYLNEKYGRFNFPSDFRYLDLGDYFIIRYPESADQ